MKKSRLAAGRMTARRKDFGLVWRLILFGWGPVILLFIAHCILRSGYGAWYKASDSLTAFLDEKLAVTTAVLVFFTIVYIALRIIFYFWLKNDGSHLGKAETKELAAYTVNQVIQVTLNLLESVSGEKALQCTVLIWLAGLVMMFLHAAYRVLQLVAPGFRTVSAAFMLVLSVLMILLQFSGGVYALYYRRKKEALGRQHEADERGQKLRDDAIKEIITLKNRRG